MQRRYLGVKWSQVQILSARPKFSQVRGLEALSKPPAGGRLTPNLTPVRPGREKTPARLPGQDWIGHAADEDDENTTA
jgi:hypothetical protein